MAFSFVQTKQNVTGSGTSLVITPDVTLTRNNLVVISIKTGSGVSNPSVTDNASTPNTYALAAGPVTGSATHLAWQFYGVQVMGGATTVTVSWTGTSSARITIDEFSGGLRTNTTVYDKSSTGTGTGTSGSVASFSPVANGELIVAGVGMTAFTGITAGTNYTLATTQTNQSTEYRLSGTTTETAPISWTESGIWTNIASAFFPESIKTVDGLAIVSVKTIEGLAIASVKSINGLQ